MNKVAIINTSHTELDPSLVRDLNDENNSFKLLSSKGKTVWDNLNSLEDTHQYNHLLIGQFEEDKIINLTSIFKKKVQTASPQDQLFIAFSPNGKKANILKLIIKHLDKNYFINSSPCIYGFKASGIRILPSFC